MSTGIGMPTAAAPTAYQHKDKDHSTTHSAVEEGVIIIRDKDKQQQDINTLSRDTTNANNELDPIFDKQKELDRIEKIELVADIASQAKDLAQKYSRMQAEEKYKSAQEKYNALTPEEKALADKAIEEDLKKHGIDLSKYDEKDRPAVIRDEYIRQTVQREGIGNMGDGFSKGIDAATSIVIGIIKGDITGGLAGASAPYLATLIKEQTGESKAANLVAHAILGAVVAELQGNSGLSGGIGALTGEVAAEFMAKHIYGKDVKDLTEAEKRNISSLAQLASGLAVASVGGNTGDIAAAIASSKNAVENNALSKDDAAKREGLKARLNYFKKLDDEERVKILEQIAVLDELDKFDDNEFIKACTGGGNNTSADCASHLAKLRAFKADYDVSVARSTYGEVYKDDYNKIVHYLNDYTPDSWTYAMANYAKENGISYEEAEGKFGYILWVNKISNIAALYYSVKNAEIVNNKMIQANLAKSEAAINEYNVLKGKLNQKNTSETIVKNSIPNIKGTQIGLRDPAQIELIKQDMLNDGFDFSSSRGKIAGYIDNKGNYYVTEGHHRMAAAQEIYKSTGDAAYINKLLENGKWDPVQNAPSDARPLPTRK